MEINVESITRPHVKALARIINPGNKIQVTGTLTDHVVTYDSIQVFANHWRFIEDKPKELLKPGVQQFIKHYLYLNDKKPNQVISIRFSNYNEWIECTIDLTAGVSLDFDLTANMIDFNLIEDGEEYTLEELGIR